MSASRTFTLLKAESKGFEPLHRINDDGLANHYITTLSTLHFFCGEKEIRTLDPPSGGQSVFPQDAVHKTAS